MSGNRASYPAMSSQPAFAEESVPPMSTPPVEPSPAPLLRGPRPRAVRGKLTKGPKSLQGIEGCQHAVSGWTPVGYYKPTKGTKSHADLCAIQENQEGHITANESSRKATPAKEDLLRPPSTQPTRSKSATPGYTDSDAGSSAPPSSYSRTSSVELDDSVEPDDDLSKTVVLDPRSHSCRPHSIHAAVSTQGLTFQHPYGSFYNAGISGLSSSGIAGEGSMPDLMIDSLSSVIQRESSTGSMSSVLMTPEFAGPTAFLPHDFNGYRTSSSTYGPNGAANAPMEGLNLPPSINRHEVANGTPSIAVDDASEPDWQMVHHSSVRDGSGFNYVGPTASYAIQPLFTDQSDYFGFPSFTNESGRY